MRSPLTAAIFLLSLAMLLLEVSYTRIFSYKLVYYFTYVVIGIALLGLGSGGVLVATSPRLRTAGLRRLVAGAGFVGALATLVGYVVVARVQVNAIDIVGGAGRAVVALETAKLGVVCLALFLPFLVGGLAVSAILATGGERMGRLYGADLLGAALGCAAAVPLIAALTPPGTVLLAGACLGAAGLAAAPADRRAARVACGLATALLVAVALRPDVLPDPIPDRVKSMAPQKSAPRAIFSRWSPVFRVDVLADLGVPGAPAGTRMISHDGMWGSILSEWNGDVATLARYDTMARAVPFRVLAPHPRVAIIGAAGGNEILASLFFDAAHVTGVELNPVTVSLLTEHFRDYTGGLATNPRVTLVNAEGRSFLATTPAAYDLVWFVAPDSYAAMNAATSGAYVLSESYLYTAEMIVDSFRALAPGGIVCTQFGEGSFERKPNRTTRYVATARAALARLGVDDPTRHVLVATSKGFGFTTSTILLRREPFTDAQIAKFVETVAAIDGGQVRFAAGQPSASEPIAKALTLPPAELAQWFRSYAYDVRPVTDDAPFFWHFVPFRSVLGRRETTGPMPQFEDGLGERLLLVLLGLVVVFGAIFLLVPLAAERRLWAKIPYKAHAAVYFAALGVGFMFLEVTLIQRFTLFLGYPTYSLSVTLFALLCSTSAGSLLGERLTLPRRRLLLRLGLGLAVLVAFYRAGLGPLLASGVAWPLPLRVLVAALAIAPLGLCLGLFMPLGLRTVAGLSPHAEAYVAWAWAVNGFCSVASSVLATILSMSFGFGTVMLVALAVYAAGIVALARIPEPTVV